MRIRLLSATLAAAALPLCASALTLNAHPGPANNGGSTGWAIFFDVTATNPNGVNITGMSTASTAVANGAFTVEVFRRVGTALGGPVASGPGSSPAGWTSLGTAPAMQGPTSSGVSLVFNIPTITLNPSELTGIAILFTGAGPRYFGTGTPAYSNFSDANLSLVTGDARSVPFTPGGSFFSSRALVGSLVYEVIPTPGSAALLGIAALAAVRRRR